MGDRGYARLRAGRSEDAREPLAKALELTPGNAKATANLSLWAVLRGDTAPAEQLARHANLNDETGRSIQQQAQQIRSRLQQRQSAAVAPPPPPATATPARSMRLAAEARRDSTTDRDPAHLPPSMLERFGSARPANEGTP